MKKYKQGCNPNTLSNLKDTTAPDNPGETQTITVRIRVDQKDWLEAQEESKSYLVRQALDKYIAKLSNTPLSLNDRSPQTCH